MLTRRYVETSSGSLRGRSMLPEAQHDHQRSTSRSSTRSSSRPRSLHEGRSSSREKSVYQSSTLQPSQSSSGYNSTGQPSPPHTETTTPTVPRHGTEPRMFKAGARLLMSPYEQVKSYQRQFEDDAYELAQNGLLEKILELNELLTSRKLDIAYAPKVDVSALKDCPDNLIELMTVVEELYTDAAETLRKIRTWLCTMTIRSSGSVPDEVVNCVTQGIDSCWHVLKKNIEQYHFQRAERAAKYMTYPQLDDYKTSMCYLDRMHWVELRDNIVLLRDRYMLTHDMLEKYVLSPRSKRRSDTFN